MTPIATDDRLPVTSPALAARGVSRRYGVRYAVREVSFTLAPGQVLLLAGANGAGKTTLLRLLAGLLRPSSGVVERAGAVGLVAHHSMLYETLTARENLRFFSRLHGLAGDGRAEELLELLGLARRGDEPIGGFSRGMVQRLAIARALLHDPDVLLLDEPLSHLDQDSARTVLRLLVDLRARGRAMVLVAHQLAEVIEVATSVAVLAAGRLAALEPRGTDDAVLVAERFRARLAHG